jgi:hypothetical protein
MSILLLIVLILLLVGALPAWPHSQAWGYYPSGGLGLVVVVVLLLALMGRICVWPCPRCSSIGADGAIRSPRFVVLAARTFLPEHSLPASLHCAPLRPPFSSASSLIFLYRVASTDARRAPHATSRVPSNAMNNARRRIVTLAHADEAREVVELANRVAPPWHARC